MAILSFITLVAFNPSVLYTLGHKNNNNNKSNINNSNIGAKETYS